MPPPKVGDTPPPPPPPSTGRVIDLTENTVRQAGFDPAHVSNESLVVGNDRHPRLGGSYESFVPKDDQGRQALEAAGYHRIEVSSSDDEGNDVVVERYLSPADHRTYTTRQTQADALRAQDDRARFGELSRPQGHGRLEAARAGTERYYLMGPMRITAGSEEDVPPPPQFEGRTIRENTPALARRDAEASMRNEGLVPHRTPGNPREIWMSPTQWLAYQRAGGEIYQP